MPPESSSIETVGGLAAIVLCLLLPQAKAGNLAANLAPESDTVESP